MKFCSVGTVKLYRERRADAGERAYMFDSTQRKPKNKEEFLKLIPSARTIGLGENGGKIKTAPIAGVRSGKRYLLALRALNFNMSASETSPFSIATRDFDSMLTMYGIYSDQNLASPGYPSQTVTPRIGLNSNKAVCDGYNALTFNNALMVIAPPYLENTNIMYDVLSRTTHSYYLDNGSWNGGRTVYTYDTYTQYMAHVYMSFSNYAQGMNRSSQINNVPAGTSALRLGSVTANAANFYQPNYDTYYFVNNHGGGSPSTSTRTGTTSTASANNFTQQSAPYISVSTANENISLSFSAMARREMNDWCVTVSDFGTDLILDADPIPNTAPNVTLSESSVPMFPSIYNL